MLIFIHLVKPQLQTFYLHKNRDEIHYKNYLFYTSLHTNIKTTNNNYDVLENTNERKYIAFMHESCG